MRSAALFVYQGTLRQTHLPRDELYSSSSSKCCAGTVGPPGSAEPFKIYARFKTRGIDQRNPLGSGESGDLSLRHRLTPLKQLRAPIIYDFQRRAFASACKEKSKCRNSKRRISHKRIARYCEHVCVASYNSCSLKECGADQPTRTKGCRRLATPAPSSKPNRLRRDSNTPASFAVRGS